MRYIPKHPSRIPKKQGQVLSIRGLNWTDNYATGQLKDCVNITSSRYPYFATRRAREKQTAYSNAIALTHWNALVVVQKVGNQYQVYYNGNPVQNAYLTAGEKQFAVINTKLVIFPDKKYLDLNTLTLHDLGASVTTAGATFDGSSITLNTNQALEGVFNVGDGVTISGCTEAFNNKTFVIQRINGATLTGYEDAEIFAAETEPTSVDITVERAIPDFDYICESNNRLWGCVVSEQTIYASALGDPTNFFRFEELSTDSYAVSVGTEGGFTGCCKLGSSVLFWKNNVLHKVLGSYPAEYQIYTYGIEGVLDGSYKSMQVVNETLIYLSAHGVYSYSGGVTTKLSSAFGDVYLRNGVAGSDGVNYYLSCQNGVTGDWMLLVYDTKVGEWLKQDAVRAVDFARVGKDLYFLTNEGDVYLADNGKQDEDIPWMMQFVPFIETQSGSYNSSSSIFEKKRYNKVILRVELPEGSRARVEVRFDNGRWEEVEKLTDYTYNIKPVVIAVNRCDKFEIRLSGTGAFALLNMERQYIVGSDKE